MTMRLIGPRLARVALIGALLCTVGCPPPDDPDVGFIGDAGPPELEVGTGDGAFVALSNGDSLELIHGPQGGWHVIVSARMSGVELDGAQLVIEVIAGDGAEVLARVSLALLERRLDREGPSYFKLNNFLIFDVAGPSEIADRDVVIRARLEAGGLVLEDERSATVIDALP
jgi:hypothetical protein